MAGILAGFATGAATSALALSALSLLTSDHLPGPNPPAAPAEQLRTSVRPSEPDMPAAAPSSRDADPYVRPGSGTEASAPVDSSTSGSAEPAVMPRPALQVAPPSRPGGIAGNAEPTPASADPAVPVRTVPALPDPGRSRPFQAGAAPASPAPEPEPEMPAEAASPELPAPSAPPAVALAPDASTPAATVEEGGEVLDAVDAAPEPAAPIVPVERVEGGSSPADTSPESIVILDATPSGDTAAASDREEPEPVELVANEAAAPAQPAPPVEEGTSVQFKQVTVPDAREGNERVVTNRLPQIGDGTDEEQADAEVPDEEAPAEIVDEAPGGERALLANAMAFEPSAGRPALGVVLRDTPPRPTAEELAELGLAVTFSVDVRAPDAAEAIALYRGAGFEVALSGDLPNGAQGGDAETAVEDWLRRYPGAVAFVESTAGGLQPSREAMRGVTGRLAESGHGLVTYPRGLNAVQQVAGSVGVPSALLFRDLSGMDGVARLMDQAAFRATREDDVVVIGDATPAVLAALSEWAASSGGERVQPAPLSHVLTGDAAEVDASN